MFNKISANPANQKVDQGIDDQEKKEYAWKKLNRVISCTSVNSFHNEHLTYIIALFESGFMNKTDSKVKKNRESACFCVEKTEKWMKKHEKVL